MIDSVTSREHYSSVAFIKRDCVLCRDGREGARRNVELSLSVYTSLASASQLVTTYQFQWSWMLSHPINGWMD